MCSRRHILVRAAQSSAAVGLLAGRGRKARRYPAGTQRVCQSGLGLPAPDARRSEHSRVRRTSGFATRCPGRRDCQCIRNHCRGESRSLREPPDMLVDRQLTTLPTLDPTTASGACSMCLSTSDSGTHFAADRCHNPHCRNRLPSDERAGARHASASFCASPSA